MSMICEQMLGLLYGSIVNQVLRNSQNYPQANQRLQKIGYKIGIKIVDEYMRDSSLKPCQKIQQLVQKFCNIGVKKFLNPTQSRCEQYKKKQKGCEFNLKITGNPLFNYVQMPIQLKSGNLQYQAIIKGAIRGAFQILKFKATISLIYQSLKGQKNQSIFYVDITHDH